MSKIRIIYRAADDSMGDGMTVRDCQAYRDWAKQKLAKLYPYAEVEAVNEQGESAVDVQTCEECSGFGCTIGFEGRRKVRHPCESCDGRDTFNDEDLEDRIKAEMASLWDRCDWREVG